MLSNLAEILVSLAFVVLLALKLDPLDLLMPNKVQMIILALLVAAAGLYAGILFRQKARDEREALHLYGRAASPTSPAWPSSSWRSPSSPFEEERTLGFSTSLRAW